MSKATVQNVMKYTNLVLRALATVRHFDEICIIAFLQCALACIGCLSCRFQAVQRGLYEGNPVQYMACGAEYDRTILGSHVQSDVALVKFCSLHRGASSTHWYASLKRHLSITGR
jgi:hypothetical protein